MLCDSCKEREAVINLTQVEHDSKVTLHLCEQCAQAKGVETGVAVLKSPLGGFITAMGKGATSVLPTTDGLRCSSCGGTLKDFRDSGRLGCAQCYEAFDAHLTCCGACTGPASTWASATWCPGTSTRTHGASCWT